VGVLLEAASARNKGGRRHGLLDALAQLSEEDAKDLRAVLAQPHEAVEWSAVHEALRGLGVKCSASTVGNWSKDYKLDPERFA
jgi:hypothetical protein